VKVGDPDGPFSYLRIADVIRRTGEDARSDAKQLFERMALNVLAGNSDDHLRNHGFIRVSQTTYKLSPVFDVLPHPGEVSLQALVVGREGRSASITNLLSSCERFGIAHDEAVGMIRDIQDVLNESPQFYANAGMEIPEARALSAVCTRLRTDIPSLTINRGPRQ
jgi:serine/threonine-protein kinase HipA